MDAVAVKAACALIAKVVPDLKAIEHKAPAGSVINYTLMVPPKDG